MGIRFSAKYIACLLAVGVLPAAMAHHAPSGFNQNKRLVFKGEVRKFAWVNPHAYLYVDVIKADGSKELWGFETGGPSSLNRNGWKIADFQPGAKVTVYANTARSDKKNALMRKVRLADGRELSSMDIGLAAPAANGAPASGPPRDAYADYAEYK
jgi:hypothetical protein